jgi:single-strand DNA-binding protein
MADMNSVNIVGRLTRDCQVKTLPNGTSLVEFSIANNTGWGDKARTTFVDVKFWGSGAVAIQSYLQKGKRVGVTGTLQFDSWQDKTTGTNRSKVYINTFDVQLLDGKVETVPGTNEQVGFKRVIVEYPEDTPF